MTDYQQITDSSLDARTRTRYQSETASLEALGFRYLASCLEIQGPFSAIWQLPVLLLTLPKREILVFPWPLRLAIANALLRHDDPPTVVLCMGRGVKFYSRLSGGTLLITSTFQSYAVPRAGSTILKLNPSSDIAQAWAAHGEAVRNLEHGKGPARNIISFEDYVTFSRQEEDTSQYE
jgi:hypothetical protein